MIAVPRSAFYGIDGVAIGPFRFPAPGLVRPIGAAFHRHLVADHESRIEADTELADDVHIAFGLVFGHVLPEGPGPAAGNDAQVVFQILFAHPDAVVPDHNRPGLFIQHQIDSEILPGYVRQMLGQRPVIELVQRVAGVGNQLPQEDFPMGVNGIDHQIEQPLGLCFELFASHIVASKG